MSESTYYDAFISYRRENGFLMAQVVYDRLRERGIRCFFDLEELRSGKFDEKILLAIHETHTFILILPKDALNRCVNKDDWVRQEITEAIRCNKVIIPVMYDGFEWPKEWNKEFPKEFYGLEKNNGVSGSKEYLPAMIDKIISYMPQDLIHPKQPFIWNTETKLDEWDIFNMSHKDNNTMDTFSFITACLKDIKNVSEIDMYFRGGSEWYLNSKVVELLSYLLEKEIKLRVIINEKETVEETAKHMRHNLRKYYGYDNNVSNWKEIQKKYARQISVRLAEVPLMRRYYNVRGEHKGRMKVSYYTYGNPYPERDHQNIMVSSDKSYKLYAEEFDYLWTKGSHKI